MNEFNPGDGWREVPPEDRRAEVQWYGNPAGLDPVKAWIRVPPVPLLPTAPYTVIRVTWREDVDPGAFPDGVLTLRENGTWNGTEPAFILGDITGFEVLAEPRAVTAKAFLGKVREALPLGADRFSQDHLTLIAREFGVDQPIPAWVPTTTSAS